VPSKLLLNRQPISGQDIGFEQLTTNNQQRSLASCY
jgi:hypothetical protein